MNKQTTLAILVVIVIAVAVVGVVYGLSYVLQTSNQVDVTVTNGIVQVPITLAANATTLTDLDSLKLTATTGANGNGLTCHFYDGTISIGSAVIAAGKAEITLTPAIGVHHYTAGP